MIEKTDAIEIVWKNLDRTNALFAAMDKIKAYNRLYQMRESAINREFGQLVTEIQEKELNRIERSCAEHAIISLATAFETFYKELLQELLAKNSVFFLSQNNVTVTTIRKLVNSQKIFSYDGIEKKLKLRNRFDYYRIFKDFSISFLLPKEDEFIEYLYTKRNNFVHNAGKLDTKTKKKLQKIEKSIDENVFRTEAKKLRTKFQRIIPLIHRRAVESVASDTE